MTERNPRRLAGAAAIVTGAAHGIGRAGASRLTDEGAGVRPGAPPQSAATRKARDHEPAAAA